jgi:hypothetical protein
MAYDSSVKIINPFEMLQRATPTVNEVNVYAKERFCMLDGFYLAFILTKVTRHTWVTI